MPWSVVDYICSKWYSGLANIMQSLDYIIPVVTVTLWVIIPYYFACWNNLGPQDHDTVPAGRSIETLTVVWLFLADMY